MKGELHWREYFSEALCLGLFMLSAAMFGALLEAPDSPLRRELESPFHRRFLMGGLMGVTAATLIYSPFGRRSGAHMNPAVTLNYFFLGKVKLHDALFYMFFQFLGGLFGIFVAWAILGNALALPPVNFVATLPGALGTSVAFIAEYTISLLLFYVVLLLSNNVHLRDYTGAAAAIMVCLFITLEAPFSGMSMNPARTFASALPWGIWSSVWIYFIAPPLGMLSASVAYRTLHSKNSIQCAKLIHGRKHRCLFCGCGPLVLAILVFSPVPASSQMKVNEVKGIEFHVKDISRSISFYQDVLGFSTEWENGVVSMKLGEERIRLKQFDSTCSSILPSDGRANDLWFQHAAIVVSDMDKAYRVLREHGVQHVSNLPQTIPAWNKRAAGIRAFYFRDPDGHNLELIYFPKGKGRPRWQKSSNRLFLGIDHTAIAVSDTEQSLQFYRDELGLRVFAETENWGPEQEHLNNLFGAHVRITGLGVENGMGIELLEFLSPPGGRRPSPDVCEGDILSVTTLLGTADRLKKLRDPDWHSIRIEQ